MILEPLGEPPSDPPEPARADGQLVCLACHIQAHNARTAGMPEPPVNPADTIVNGSAICFDHLTIQSVSPLAVPPGTQLPKLPPGMLG